MSTKQKRLPKPLRDTRERDKEFLRVAESYRTARKYDFSKICDISEFERRINEKFEIGNQHSKKELNPSNGLVGLDRAGPHLKKRKKAVMQYAGEADLRFGKKYDALSIPDELLRLNAAPVGITFGMCEYENNNDVATALWMLDQLEACGNLSEAYRFFPDNLTARKGVTIPPISDSCHSDELLHCMVYIIRRIDLQDDGTGMTPMQRFRAILKLIDPYAIRSAVSKFEEKMWYFFDCILYCTNFHRQLQVKYADELYKLVSKCQMYNNELIEIYRQHESYKVPSKLMLGTVNPENVANYEMAFLTANRNRAERIRDMLLKIAPQIDEMLNGIDLEEYLIELLCLVGPYLYSDKTSLDDLKVPEDHLARILSLKIEDPYEICFAHMYMLVEGIDSVWLYSQSVSVLYAAAMHLPWTVTLNKYGWGCEQKEISGSMLYDEEDVFSFNASEIQQTVNYTDMQAAMYQRIYKDKGLWADPALASRKEIESVNIPQIVYALTGTVMPRRPNEDAEIAERLKSCGVKPSMRMILGQYIRLASACAGGDDVSTERVVSNTTESELKEQVEKYRAELLRLDGLLNASIKDKNAERKRADTMVVQLESSRVEIAELRAMIYDRAIYLKEKKPNVQFPYSVRQKVTVFGGHEVWLNMMRPLLSGVRYVGPDEKPNMSVLMNTDVIWLQTNVMAHSFYNKVVEIARKHHIPVRYFSYSGAEKCAEQLALDDMNS